MDAQADLSYGYGYGDGVASVTVQVITEDISLSLPSGWSMFGYTCVDAVDALEAFSSISDKVIIMKDENGNAYVPEWNFNALGNLEYSEGYQIKMYETVTGFQFCPTIIGAE